MGKLRKLINNPSLFFYDMAKKRGHIGNDAMSPPGVKMQSQAKPAAKTPAKAPAKPALSSIESASAKPALDTIDTSAINFFMPAYLMIHTGEGEASGSLHLNSWIPYFAASGCPFVILTRNIALYKSIRAKYPLFPVVFAKNPIDVEAVVNRLPALKACFYPSNTGNNIHLLRFNHFEHIFIGHGDSDKSASAHKFFRVYDAIWVAGQAHIDRFKNAGFEPRHLNFVKVGRPNLREILIRSEKPWHDRGFVPNILYLPTWEGTFEEQNYSSTLLSGELIRCIKQRFDVDMSIKFHPMTGNRKKNLLNIHEELGNALDQQGIDAVIEQKSTPINHLLRTANVFVCDISAAVSECLSANGPIFVFIPQDREIKLSSSDMSYEYYSYTFHTIEELMAKMNQVLNGDDYLAERRMEAIDYMIGKEQTLHSEFIRQLKSFEISETT
ncbi:CDP-glycerol glycerophosphotransferase family protein [Chromobacterium alkanivorans]|uniref:CDP-glycerol glycerophosphotransferase family protein n=1 Tax=Chromobacterium alkanivorans TaxID=1071719 RepID=UPI0019680DC0|nr:CDP-glycerol glycerophosphotransferase family protein [Chromobacterium alkanivorans]MBN3002161.1 CDP-glycerol glycerophosphotransferase family protein [Chromobacterium alkanivorans]